MILATLLCVRTLSTFTFPIQEVFGTVLMEVDTKASVWIVDPGRPKSISISDEAEKTIKRLLSIKEQTKFANQPAGFFERTFVQAKVKRFAVQGVLGFDVLSQLVLTVDLRSKKIMTGDTRESLAEFKSGPRLESDSVRLDKKGLITKAPIGGSATFSFGASSIIGPEHSSLGSGKFIEITAQRALLPTSFDTGVLGRPGAGNLGTGMEVFYINDAWEGNKASISAREYGVTAFLWDGPDRRITIPALSETEKRDNQLSWWLTVSCKLEPNRFALASGPLFVGSTKVLDNDGSWELAKIGSLDLIKTRNAFDIKTYRQNYNRDLSREWLENLLRIVPLEVKNGASVFNADTVLAPGKLSMYPGS